MRKIVSLVLVILLAHLTTASVSAAQRAVETAARREKVKADVARRGVGEKARVKVRLLDGSELKGRISEAGEDSFQLVDDKTGAATRLSYDDVSRVRGAGMSRGRKIGLITGVTAAVLVVGIIGLRAGDGVLFPSGP